MYFTDFRLYLGIFGGDGACSLYDVYPEFFGGACEDSVDINAYH